MTKKMDGYSSIGMTGLIIQKKMKNKRRDNVVILCKKCHYNRATFIEKISKHVGFAECNKCSEPANVHFIN